MSKTLKLPDSQEIMRRLQQVQMGDNGHMSQNFFPLIAAEGGRELVASGIVLMLTLKIHDFVNSGYPPIMGPILNMYMPQLIDALVDDKDIAEEAKQLLTAPR